MLCKPAPPSYNTDTIGHNINLPIPQNIFLMNKISIAAAGAVLLAFGTINTADAFNIVPGNLEKKEGNSNGGIPFNISYFGVSSMRYQQVFAAGEFSSSEPFLITQILFRPDTNMGEKFSSTLPFTQINLSTTSKAPDNLSTTFANNIGSDDTVVFSGRLSLNSAFTGQAKAPKDFDIAIDLTKPFLYDPKLGNLLLDARNFLGGTTTQFDAENTLGDSISRVFINPFTSRVTADSSGLVTKFKIAAIPNKAVDEPTSILSLLVFAVGASAAKLLRI